MTENIIVLILVSIVFIGVALYFIVPLYRKRKCFRCKTAVMKRKFDDDENEYIFVCPECKYVERSGIFIGGGDP